LNARRLVITVYAIVLLGFAVAAAELLTDARIEYPHLQRVEAASRTRLAEAQARLAEQQRILERLKTDRGYVEKVIRKQLNYAKPGEVIFRFED